MPFNYDEFSNPLQPGLEGPAERTSSMSGLRTLSYAEAAALLQPKKSSFFEDLFHRIDSSGDKSIDRKEVKAHLKNVGVSGGLFGIVHKIVAGKFIEQLDQDGDEKVTLNEFRGVANQLMPPNLFDEQGNLKPALVAETFRKLDADGDGRVTVKEFEETLLKELPEDTANRAIVAEVMAKLGSDAMDLDRGGAVEKPEFKEAAKAVDELKS